MHLMKKIATTMMALVLAAGLAAAARADGADPKAVLDKAVQALGGAEKLGKVKAVSWTTKGTVTFMGSDNPLTIRNTVQGLDRVRQEFDLDLNGMTINAVAVLAGDKGWYVMMGGVDELDKATLANEKRLTYLAVIPVTILPLKESGFKVEGLADEKVGDKPAAVLKVTPPDGKEFRLYFDQESGLPVRVVAKVVDFHGQEYTQEVTFSDYKEMSGIRKATRIESKRDGEKFINQQVTEFKVLDQVDPKTFEQPK
jgi:hypothetical protein